MHAEDHDGRYPRNLNSLVPEYLKTIPECPEVESQTYRYQQGRNAFANTVYEDYYYIECSGMNHSRQGIMAPNYPRYDAVEGLTERP